MAQTVLLTGANGFLGSHILSELLASGFNVRSVVRSQAKVSQLQQDFSTYTSQLDFAIVPDMTAPHAFDAAVQSTPPLTAVIHQASPFFFATIASNADFLDPAINGTTALLRAIKAHAPSVRRVIYTSSCAAVFDFDAPVASSPARIYTAQDWNPITYAQALTGTKADAYRASKKFAELAAWKFVEEENPGFDLVSINPPMIWGPAVRASKRIADVNESNARIYAQFVNSKKEAAVPDNGLHLYVDVRDLAVAHVRAVTEPRAGGERIIVCARAVSAQGICDVLRGNIAELGERTPMGMPGTSSLPEGAFGVSSEKAESILGCVFRRQEETFVEMGKQLLEIEARS